MPPTSPGSDPRQTSDALGAAAVQLGPEALALGVKMNKALGMPHADVAAVLQDGFGLGVNRSTMCRAVDRVAQRGQATWHALRGAARRSMVNAIDETGWNVEAQLRWLWVVVSEQVTFCDILPGRSFEQAAALLGADYNGWLTHDGWRCTTVSPSQPSKLHPASASSVPRHGPGSLSRSRLLPAAGACPARGRLGLTRSL